MKDERVRDAEARGWRKIGGIDLVENKKEALLVNISCIVLMLLMCALIPFFVKDGFLSYFSNAGFLQPIALFFAIFLYIPLHEIVHGIVLKFFTDEKISFGWKGVYAYCGSKEAMLSSYEYFLVALAPALVFTLIFLPPTFIFPSWSLFWYFLEIINISGSVGDFYVVIKIWGKRKDNILISDSGTSMTIWSK